MFYFLLTLLIAILLIGLFVFLRLEAWARYEMLEHIMRDLTPSESPVLADLERTSTDAASSYYDQY